MLGFHVLRLGRVGVGRQSQRLRRQAARQHGRGRRARRRFDRPHVVRDDGPRLLVSVFLLLGISSFSSCFSFVDRRGGRGRSVLVLAPGLVLGFGRGIRYRIGRGIRYRIRHRVLPEHAPDRVPPGGELLERGPFQAVRRDRLARLVLQVAFGDGGHEPAPADDDVGVGRVAVAHLLGKPDDARGPVRPHLPGPLEFAPALAEALERPAHLVREGGLAGAEQALEARDVRAGLQVEPQVPGGRPGGRQRAEPSFAPEGCVDGAPGALHFHRRAPRDGCRGAGGGGIRLADSPRPGLRCIITVYLRSV